VTANARVPQDTEYDNWPAEIARSDATAAASLPDARARRRVDGSQREQDRHDRNEDQQLDDRQASRRGHRIFSFFA
jgi:hypothetical protein